MDTSARRVAVETNLTVPRIGRGLARGPYRSDRPLSGRWTTSPLGEPAPWAPPFRILAPRLPWSADRPVAKAILLQRFSSLRSAQARRFASTAIGRSSFRMKILRMRSFASRLARRGWRSYLRVVRKLWSECRRKGTSLVRGCLAGQAPPEWGHGNRNGSGNDRSD